MTLIIILAAVWAFLIGRQAYKLGRNPIMWFILSLTITPIIASITLGVLGKAGSSITQSEQLIKEMGVKKETATLKSELESNYINKSFLIAIIIAILAALFSYGTYRINATEKATHDPTNWDLYLANPQADTQSIYHAIQVGLIFGFIYLAYRYITNLAKK